MNTIIQTSIVMTYEELELLTSGRIKRDSSAENPVSCVKSSEEIFRMLTERGIMRNIGDGYIMDAALHFILHALCAPNTKIQSSCDVFLCDCHTFLVIIEPYHMLPGGCTILPFQTKEQAMRHLGGSFNG